MSNKQRTRDKNLAKKFLQCYNPQRTASKGKRGWYYSELEYIS